MGLIELISPNLEQAIIISSIFKTDTSFYRELFDVHPNQIAGTPYKSRITNSE
jgi:hypothetical protein